MLLKLSGFTVVTAYDGQEAVDVALAEQPDVVLLDIGLPKLDGYEVARRLRDSPATKDALMIAITGYGRDDDRRKAQNAGFDHHLTKPVNFTELLTMLGKQKPAMCA